MVSNIGDFGTRTIPQTYPWVQPYLSPNTLGSQGPLGQGQYIPDVSRDEFDKLKKELELLKEVLVKAKIYDEQTGQPDCEMEEKVKLLKRLGELVGVDLGI